MAAAAVEQPINQLTHKLETMKIDAHRKVNDKPEFCGSNHQLYPNYGDMFQCNASVASSEMMGDGASSYCSREDFPELGYIPTTTGYVPAHGTIYAGSPSPVMHCQGYGPYQMDGMYYYNPVVDYGYANQPIYGSLPSGMQYPVPGNDGYLYGPQIYQYPMQTYYQQAPSGQYVPAASSVGGMVMLEPQESGVVIPDGFNNSYAGPIPTGTPTPMTFLPPPPMSSETSALPTISVSYPHPVVPHAPHTLRASASAWIEPVQELHGSFKEKKPVEISVPAVVNKILPPSKVMSSISTNPVVPQGNAPSTVKVAAGGTSVPSHQGSDIEERVQPAHSKLPPKRDVVFPNGQSVTQSHRIENSIQAKGQLYTPGSKPAKLFPAPLGREACLCLPNGERYNVEDFVTKYEDAKHFIIKSYSEENVFRSIQYGVWASTPNGNKKLDDAYHDAQRRAAGRPHGCPVFLFFSVNGSRQFCGVAEMMGPVDYKRSMEFWEQHKWSGSLPLKWHFIKDVPNSQFRKIILQNNENKPVTNSRDTQEVPFHLGLEMLNIVKAYPARTSILDEFPLCSLPIKAIPDFKPQPHWCPQSFPKIGEAIKGRGEEPNLKGQSVRAVPAALKVCDNGVVKPKEMTPPSKPSAASKVLPQVVG